MAKVLVIITGKDHDRILPGLMWSINALKYRWVEDLEVIFFGSSEWLIADDDPLVMDSIKKLRAAGKEPIACRRIAENSKILEKLEGKVRVEFVGKLIGEKISEGYTPMTF